MLFMMFIHGDERAAASWLPEALEQMLAAFGCYNAELSAAGALRAAGQLAPASMARLVSASAGGLTVQAGPAQPGPSQIGGYYLLDVAHAEAAQDWAARCPAAMEGVIEVRAVVFAPI